MNGNEIKRIRMGNILLQPGVDYVFDGNTLVFMPAFLNVLSAGENTITLDMNLGVREIDFVIIVS